MEPDFKRLLLPVPPAFAETLGYPGNSRFVAFCWMPVGDELLYSDGQISGTGDYAPWLLWTQHFAVAPALLGFDFGSSDAEATHWLLLDRQDACFYVGTAHAVAQFLRDQPEAQALRAAWERLSPDEQQCLLTKVTERLQPIFQDTTTPSWENLERSLRDSQQRYRGLEAWLAQPPPMLA